MANNKLYIIEVNDHLMSSTATTSRAQAKIDYEEYRENKTKSVKQVRLLEYVINNIHATTSVEEAFNEKLKVDTIKRG